MRVATLDIWSRSGPRPDRLRPVRSELQRLAPDVIGLQECVRYLVLEPQESALRLDRRLVKGRERRPVRSRSPRPTTTHASGKNRMSAWTVSS
ncbi:endonuclease/exonuclease/phosphatase family protein [Actinacidiphila oryziradicis]|uniref:Endonuclease/exonuclease/phosphatase domain-containing protein n=1 Tax=Actinacidiphila oryziradicis TaxID=2571141 RepID=A0A4U0SNN6_9ACTN|nr:hypothetical protein [Actinacidiphila oryziradicis]TKA09771.1 hypothetical protein FCI23_20420 [Actinacidiphila oryziradicis]